MRRVLLCSASMAIGIYDCAESWKTACKRNIHPCASVVLVSAFTVLAAQETSCHEHYRGNMWDRLEWPNRRIEQSAARPYRILGKLRRVNVHQLRLRGGSSFAVGAPLDGIGAPGYDEDICGDHLLPLGPRKTPQNVEMIVPGTHDNMTHAIRSAGDTHQTILACSGDHRWMDLLETERALNGSIDVRGQAHTRLLGRWHLYSVPRLGVSSRGSFMQLTCAYATDNYGKVLDGPHALFAIMGGPWNYVGCELRAAAADVLACFSVARVVAERCLIGGMGCYNASNGTMLAVGGVHAADTSAVHLRQSSLEFCGRYFASALEARQQGEVVMDRSFLRYNLVGAKVDGAGKLHILNSHLYENYCCQLIAGDNTTDAELRCHNTTIIEGPAEGQSPVWLPTSHERPGILQLDENDIRRPAPPPISAVDPIYCDDGWQNWYGSDDGGCEAANLPALEQLRADELDMDPRLMHVDVVAELMRLAEQERVLSDSVEELRRVVAAVEQRNAAELSELEALPEYREEEEGDIELLSSTSASGDSSLPLVILAPQPTQSNDNINASKINSSPERPDSE